MKKKLSLFLLVTSILTLGLTACGQFSAVNPFPTTISSPNAPTVGTIQPTPTQESGVLGWVAEANNRPSSAQERKDTPLKPDPNRVVYIIPPKNTDNQIDLYLKDHYVMYYKNVAQNGKLFVFFSGSYGKPDNNQLVINQAASLGWKSIGLTYPNDTSVGEECNRNPNPECAGEVRLERFDGTDRTVKVQVSATNSIKNRLIKLLQYLDKTYPAEGWRNFLTVDGKDLEWSKIGVGGHSQGAGMAAIIAKNFEVARVAMYSGAGDQTRNGQPAAWLNQPGKTPVERYYGIVHAKEGGYANILEGYIALGLTKFGNPVETGKIGTPFNNSHLLVVSLPPDGGKSGDRTHGSTASDPVVPKKADGTTAYTEEWNYIIGK
jgi:hypothetical protein